MRPGQNKRMRGRNNNNNNNRKGPNPLTRSYESNGPDVKIRGTAFHIGEKYLQLARDAQSSGDPVMAESYLQHAEHYFRLIAAAQQAQQQAQFGYQRPPGEQIEQDDDDADDDFASLPDRFASPSERTPPAPQPQPQPQHQPAQQHQQPMPERQPYGGNGQPYADRQGERQPYEQRQERNNERNQERGQGYDARGNRGNYPDRNGQERNGFDRNAPYRGEGGNRDGGRDFDNRNFRNRNREDRQPREYRDAGPRDAGQPREYREHQPREFREPRQPVGDEQPAGGLPAFITGGARTPLESSGEATAAVETPATQADLPEDTGFHMRPRRRRRPKPDFAGVEGEGGEDAPAGDPLTD